MFFALAVRGPNTVMKWVVFFFHLCNVQVSKTELFTVLKVPEQNVNLSQHHFINERPPDISTLHDKRYSRCHYIK
jgi:hypothetical protein